ncbi:hypothetical protein Tco_0144386 [Tanacetum coccineum]
MESFDNIINQDEEHTNSPIIINSKLEIGDEFLKILQDNAFNGMDGGDVTDHIAKDMYMYEAFIDTPSIAAFNVGNITYRSRRGFGMPVVYVIPLPVIMESLVKKKQKGAILELKRRHLKNTIFCTYTPYPAMKIRRISASSAQETRNDQFPIRRIHYNQYAVCTAVHQSKIRI